MRIIGNNMHTRSIRFRHFRHFKHPCFTPKKLPVIVSKQGRKQSPGSTTTFNRAKVNIKVTTGVKSTGL